ncbi:acetate--CoA ligase family protein [Carboxylicivirga caseinilyticus]|uniref:acetate--CoA ligase family protein n=1 Tax=Carboxylicivirga caseinilyticus TaxID=3417572 RepID=UPI003D3299DC|nr:acetate--CoA ligase family protein [Marinilabiliaceae bacterium A049]
MINEQLINPKSIVVVGGSDNIQKPGGKILKNIIDGGFGGKLYVTNLNSASVQGVSAFGDVTDLPEKIDLAVIAVAAKYCLHTVEVLAYQKRVKAFIIISAGFGEENEVGAALEKQIVKVVNEVGGCLIGPNCIGVLTTHHNSVFTTPIPPLEKEGADFISGSGATAVFIMEAGVSKGLKFNSVFSVGNSAQIGVEEVLEYLDITFDQEKSSKIKLLYLESISNPKKLLKHASSLIRKGCKIAAIKAGASEAGSRAASSHTGAMANSDLAVDTLFRKAGIVRCYGREELANVAAVFMGKPLVGKNIAVITHAGGPAVMLTDTLSNGGLMVPTIEGDRADVLLTKLFPGSSISNPIDFLATGTAEQLGYIIDACELDFDHIDAMVVVFGSPGLFPINEVYDVLHQKMSTCKKPIYPVLPSVVNAKDAIDEFLSKGNFGFSDEVNLGQALVKVYNTTFSQEIIDHQQYVNCYDVRQIIENQVSGYAAPEVVQALLDAAGVSRVQEIVSDDVDQLLSAVSEIGFPIVMKVVGPVHKSDVGGVVLNVENEAQLIAEFRRMMQINEAVGVMIQPMLKGTELFVGASYEPGFGHIVLCGLGGIFVEVLKDVSSGLCPVSHTEALAMIQKLRGYKIIQGVRGNIGVDEEVFADIIVRISQMLECAPEIKEMDINPLLGEDERIVAVDARIRIER